VIWAVILAVAFYPAFSGLRRLLGGRGGLAATIVTLLGLLVVVVPLGAVTVNVVRPPSNCPRGSRTTRWPCPDRPSRCGSGR
jgi:predicted PurR-regulated permease PerM